MKHIFPEMGYNFFIIITSWPKKIPMPPRISKRFPLHAMSIMCFIYYLQNGKDRMCLASDHSVPNFIVIFHTVLELFKKNRKKLIQFQK